MSEQDLKPTDAEEIADPVELVELKHLRTKSGGPVSVLCEAVDELVAAEIYGMPGERPPMDENQPTEAQKLARARKNIANAAPLVHNGTSFVRGDGAVVRPAFHYDDAHAVPGSVAWRHVSMEDKLTVIATISRLSGYGGADDARFPRRN